MDTKQLRQTLADQFVGISDSITVEEKAGRVKIEIRPTSKGDFLSSSTSSVVMALGPDSPSIAECGINTGNDRVVFEMPVEQVDAFLQSIAVAATCE